ncbi:MAG TPA: hypothetical protein VLN57_01390, partial [Xanthobacteraceae bacterium]|nr:hypothetical protein [Xanthobacteraceae bacterium]
RNPAWQRKMDAPLVRAALDRLYLFAGFAAGGFMILIFVLMMVLSAGRPLGVNVPAGDDLVAWKDSNIVARASLPFSFCCYWPWRSSRCFQTW